MNDNNAKAEQIKEPSELTHFIEQYTKVDKQSKPLMTREILSKLSDMHQLTLSEEPSQLTPIEKLVLNAKITAFAVLLAIKDDNANDLQRAKLKLQDLVKQAEKIKITNRSTETQDEIEFILKTFVPKLGDMRLIEARTFTTSIEKNKKPKTLPPLTTGYFWWKRDLAFIPSSYSAAEDSDEETLSFVVIPDY
ncbi:MAG: hypothetical protein M3R00_02975 [Pseudomonadota bacterium]|nr:hypothetical protein [Pseudomonadota bacterium]